MADNLRLSLIIGAALGGGFRKTFGAARESVEQLSKTARRAEALCLRAELVFQRDADGQVQIGRHAMLSPCLRPSASPPRCSPRH